MEGHERHITCDRGLTGFPVDNTGPFLPTEREILASSSFASYYMEERFKNRLPVRTISPQVLGIMCRNAIEFPIAYPPKAILPLAILLISIACEPFLSPFSAASHSS